MKKIVTIMLLALWAIQMQAVPAVPGFRKYTQPDGKTYTLQLRGDEWVSWFEDHDGVKYQMDSKGYFHQISEVNAARMIRGAAQLRRRANSLRTAPEGFVDMTHGTRRIPVLLVEFSDVKFSIDNPKESFNDLLNQEGYNGYKNNGATGSVRDYYVDNSHGEFEPVFDVYGPVTLSNPIAYYGEEVVEDGMVKQHDKQAEMALYDAALLLDSQVDFSQYDYDNDGYVDMTLFYYAGGSQAEGWPTDYIWPHQWYLQYTSASPDPKSHFFDGKRLNRYFCTAELYGTQDKNTMCAIGATCHEFGHSLGLPDFYSTLTSTQGSAGALYDFSLMCGGAYLDDSRTPPYLNSEERTMLGWMNKDDVKELEPGNNYTLEGIDNNVAYKSLATDEGEYFLYETRGMGKWDSCLPKGLAAYHVDKCKYHTVGGISAYDQWEQWPSYNAINSYPDHPCFYLIAPEDQFDLNYTNAPTDDYSYFVFPGYFKESFFCPVDWEDVDNLGLKDIALSGDAVTFTTTQEMFVEGYVTGISGAPVEGVSVTLSDAADEKVVNGIGLRVTKSGLGEALTDASGKYVIDISGITSRKLLFNLSKDGYVGQERAVTVSQKMLRVDFCLRQHGEMGLDQEIKFYDENAKTYFFGEEGQESIMIGAYCPQKVWGAYEGLQIQSAKFRTPFEASAYYFIIHGEKGVTAVKVQNPSIGEKNMTELDLSGSDIRIPSGNFIIGYAVEKVTFGDQKYAMVAGAGGGCLYARLDLENPQWGDMPYTTPQMSIILRDNDYKPSLSDIGYSAIELPEGELKAGDKLNLSLKQAAGSSVKDISWTVDGAACEGEYTMTSGWHTVVATVTFTDSHKEILEAEIQVK